MVKYKGNGLLLINGDCLEVMDKLIEKGIKVDAVIADPPYGTTVCKWDLIINLEEMWKRLKKLIKKDGGSIVLFGSQPYTSKLIMSNLEMFRYQWFWESNRAANFAQAPYMPLKIIEDVNVFSYATIAANSNNRMVYNPQGLEEIDKICKGKKSNDHRPSKTDQKDYKQTKTGYPKSLIKFNKVSKPIHPTQKPVKLLEYLIKTYTNENDIILDFTMGSGSTGVACVNLNRKFIGIELDKKYFELAKERIIKAQQK